MLVYLLAVPPTSDAGLTLVPIAGRISWQYVVAARAAPRSTRFGISCCRRSCSASFRSRSSPRSRAAGSLAFDAISHRDLSLTNGCVLFAAVFVTVHALVDVLYAVANRRPRYGG